MVMNKDNRAVLAIDVDGVLADYNGAFLPYLNQALSLNLAIHDITKHNYDELAGVPAEIIKDIMDDFEGQYGIVNLSPIEGAIDSIRLLSEKYQLAVITSRRQHHQEATRAWLERHNIAMPIYMTNGMLNRMTAEVGRRTKAEIAIELQAIALIEDNENEIVHWTGDGVEMVAYAQPWNLSLAETHPHIARLEWPAIVKKFLP